MGVGVSVKGIVVIGIEMGVREPCQLKLEGTSKSASLHHKKVTFFSHRNKVFVISTKAS